MNPAYLDTYFLGTLKLHALPDHFFIITACNPMDLKLSNWENKERNKKLHTLIKESHSFSVPITGVSKDMSHREPGFLVKTTKNQALVWGKKFEQRAVFEIQNDKIFILPCFEELKKIFVGSFTGRWIGATGEKMLRK